MSHRELLSIIFRDVTYLYVVFFPHISGESLSTGTSPVSEKYRYTAPSVRNITWYLYTEKRLISSWLLTAWPLIYLVCFCFESLLNPPLYSVVVRWFEGSCHRATWLRHYVPLGLKKNIWTSSMLPITPSYLNTEWIGDKMFLKASEWPCLCRWSTPSATRAGCTRMQQWIAEGFFSE